MKILNIVVILLISLSASAQKFALIDKSKKLPIIYTDSVSAQQVIQGYFPVEKQKLDTFLANLNYLNKMIKDAKTGTRAKFQSLELRNGLTTIKVERIPMAYGDRFRATAMTVAGEVSAVNNILTGADGDKKTLKVLEGLIDYVTSNQSLYSNYREIQPKIYNVVVIGE